MYKGKVSKRFFDTLQSINCIFSEPYPHDLLRKLQTDLKISTEIPSLSVTRWAYRYKSTKVVYENYIQILEDLDCIENSKSSQRMTAKGVKLTMMGAQFQICLSVSEHFSVNSCVPQDFLSEECNLIEAMDNINSLITALKGLRNSLNWDLI